MKKKKTQNKKKQTKNKSGMMLRSKAAPRPLPRRHSPTPPKAQSPPSKKPKDEPQAKDELLAGREPGLSEQGGQPASSASGPAEPAGGHSEPASSASGPAEPAGGGSRPASSGSAWNTAHLRSRMRDWAEQQSDRPQRYDERGHRVRRDISTLLPVPFTFYQDEAGTWFNKRGEEVDEHGRPKKPRGAPGEHRSKGKNYPNRNPGGPGFNPVPLHHRFGVRCPVTPPAQGPLAAAQGPPAAAHTSPTRGEQRARSRGSPAAAQGSSAAAQGRTRPASHGPSVRERGDQRARPQRPVSRGSPAAAQGSQRPYSRGSRAAAQGSRAYSRGPSSRGGQGWRAYSTGPSSTDPSSRRGWRGRANRNDWHKYSSRSRETIRDWDRR